MRTTNPKLAAGLLEAGKREFLEKGFQGASLRNIAASLGVTTGAIYGYYTDKEAMFDALVSEPGQELVERYREVQKAFSARPLEEQVNNLPEVPEIEAAWMMDYIYDHFDEFRLLLDASHGTKFCNFVNGLVSVKPRPRLPALRWSL